MVNDTESGMGDQSDSDDSSAVGFASVDFSGVNFDIQQDDASVTDESQKALNIERSLAFGEFSQFGQDTQNDLAASPQFCRIQRLGELLVEGKYTDALRGETAQNFFAGLSDDSMSTEKVVTSIRQRVFALATESILSCVEMELLGVASLQLFLQSNYTGPTLDSSNDMAKTKLEGINPHPCFTERLNAKLNDHQKHATGCEDSKEEQQQQQQQQQLTAPKRNTQYQNAVLSELAVDGDWPCQVCTTPYFLLLARSILLALVAPSRPDWTKSRGTVDDTTVQTNLSPPPALARFASELLGAQLWCGRAVVAHERLLQAREPSRTLWIEAETVYKTSIMFQEKDVLTSHQAATVMLEWGLAEHHFDRPRKGKGSFVEAQKLSGLVIEVTGAEGVRTKFQTKATAQYLVRAKSSGVSQATKQQQPQVANKPSVHEQLVEHTEEGILLERVKFEDDKENEVAELTVLDQAILLALCLDVKNSNPTDGLTAEEMGAYLARVLNHHDDWMVYSTALLERSWLEHERSHTRERAILQMQALADQHTERLTITQSTRESIENSAPVQDRLKMLNCLVYPPRWSMIQDLADRYADLGIVTSAAELFTTIEMWDEVVACYRRAGKVPVAEKIVRERLEIRETPRMWAALGDLTNEPEHYMRAIELSRGRFSDAYVSLGEYHFGKGNLPVAAENYEMALKVRPLAPRIWFRLGIIQMQLKKWKGALAAFSEVVLQEPDEAEAWANIAAIHMHNKQSSEAYPALIESLRRNRNNWRIWVSKLYACLDLKKYDEAVQACNTILDLTASLEGVPPIEESCVRGLAGGALSSFRERQGDESSRRTMSRVLQLLNRLSSLSDEPWLFETMAYLHKNFGQDDRVLEDLMKEYRSLQSIDGWEKDDHLIRKICGVVLHIVDMHKRDGNRESLTKAKFLARGVVKRIRTSRPDDPGLPEEVKGLESALADVDGRLRLPVENSK